MIGETTAVEIRFDDTVANDPPLELDVEVGPWTNRGVDVTIRCNLEAIVRLRGTLAQPRAVGRAEVNGNRKVFCDGEAEAHIVMRPTPVDVRLTEVQPYRRLRPGPARLTVQAAGRSGRWRSTTRGAQDVVIDEPDLTERVTQSHQGIEVRLRRLQITPAGRALAKVALDCSGLRRGLSITVELLSTAPGGATYRSGYIAKPVPICDGEQTLVVEIEGEERSRVRDDFIPAGRAEVAVTAQRFSVGTRAGAVDLRAVRLDQAFVPFSARVEPRPDSRLRIGKVSGTKARGSMRCGRSVYFSVYGTIGQPTGSAVRKATGETTIRCIAGETVLFDVYWTDRKLPAGVPSAVNLRAKAGLSAGNFGPWDQTQSGRRTT